MSSKQRTVSYSPALSPNGRLNISKIGHHRQGWRDVFYILMVRPWWQIFLLIVFVFALGNLLFAFLYNLEPGSVTNAKTFFDLFNFSIHTMATVGYGTMSPATLYGNIVADFEAVVGLLAFACASGLVFAKFSRPTAKVLFSRQAVVSNRNGKPYLMFRMANERLNQILEANLNVALMRTEITLEGERIRPILDLQLVRRQMPLFALSWTALHPIDEKSPLFGKTPEELEQEQTEIYISFSGVDSVFSQPVYARYLYSFKDIYWNRRFKDIIQIEPSGRRQINFTNFHEIF